MERTARCACGSLSITAIGEPTKVSACHCEACQRRTGSAFSVAVFYERDKAMPAGQSHVHSRLGDSGLPVDFHFCPHCGSSVFWYPAFRPRLIGIAIGCFGSAAPAGPSQSVYEQHRYDWVTIDLAER